MKELDDFTVERLQAITQQPDSSTIFMYEVRALARIALAAKTAEPVYWEIAGNLFTTKEDALKPGYRGTPEPLYEEPVLNSPELPDGWKLVPVEPTRQMMSQGHFAMGGTDRGKFRRIYQAMISASPTTGKQDG